MKNEWAIVGKIYIFKNPCHSQPYFCGEIQLKVYDGNLGLGDYRRELTDVPSGNFWLPV